MKAVFLDLGGVILKIDWNRPFEFVGIDDPVRRKEIIARFQGWKEFHLFETGEISPESFFAGFNEIAGVKHPVKIWQEAWASLIIGELPGASGILDALEGVAPVYALSNTNIFHFEYQMPRYPILSRFKKIFTSFELHSRKPGVDIYLRAAAAVGAEPNECLFVDDMLENVEGARRAGMVSEQTLDSTRETTEFLAKYLPLRPSLNSSGR